MRRLMQVAAMLAMLLIGLFAGMLLPNTAHADNPSVGRFQIVPVQRLDSSDPIAVKLDTVTGTTEVIRK